MTSTEDDCAQNLRFASRHGIHATFARRAVGYFQSRLRFEPCSQTFSPIVNGNRDVGPAIIPPLFPTIYAGLKVAWIQPGPGKGSLVDDEAMLLGGTIGDFANAHSIELTASYCACHAIEAFRP